MGDNFLDMSDEDFMNMAEPDFSTPTEDPEKTEEEVKVEPEKEEEEPAEEEEEESKAGEEEEEEKAPEEGAEEKEETDGEADEKEEEEAADTIDYKAEYEKLMSPFKANGVEMTPKNVEDARRLQQMGANYHKKMAGMKPALKALKTLENNGLLDDNKLDFLIDLNNGNQDAIATLLKEKQIDPLDVDTKAESTYVPADHSASDEEVELHSVLEDLKTSPSYNKTLTVVSEDWDKASRDAVVAMPQIITVINEQIDSGIYDKVMGQVSYERRMGNFKGVSDFEAYKLTGNKMEAEGLLDAPATSTQNAPAPPPKAKVDPVKEEQRKAKKKAAGLTKSSGKVDKLPKGFNPLEMSDEEFAKFDPKLIGIK